MPAVVMFHVKHLVLFTTENTENTEFYFTAEAQRTLRV